MRKLSLIILLTVCFPFFVFGLEVKNFKDWEYVCPEDGQSKCFLSHIVTDKDGKMVLMQIVVGKIKENKYPIISFQLPPVLKHGDEITVILDNNTVMALDVRTCNKDRCQAYGALTPEFVKEFNVSSAGIVQYQSEADAMSKVYFSLAGFKKAFNYFDKHTGA